MKTSLGNHDLELGRIGYGAMVLEGYYGVTDEQSAIATLAEAANAGLMIDTADAYGIVFDQGESGSEVPTGWGFSLTINGTANYAAKALEQSLQRLKTETLDLWYLHFPDPAVPIEETVAAMAKAVNEGKVRYVGLSNVTADQVRQAHAVHPITAVQYEYSLWRREAEQTLLPTLRELGISLVCWSPLGSGFLTGTITELAEQDFRKANPRYAAENLKANTDRFAPLTSIAKELGVTPAQLALAWLLHQGDDIFAIPGTRTIDHLRENLKAAEIRLSPEVLAKLETMAPIGITRGATLI
jgi:aryl-alcohol dehydrogenase-like predicted oxidoreductase